MTKARPGPFGSHDPRGSRIWERTGLLDLIGRENFFVERPNNPTVSTRDALRRAQQILGQRQADVRVFGETRMRPEKPE